MGGHPAHAAPARDVLSLWEEGPVSEIVDLAWVAYQSGKTDRIDLLRRISTLAADKTVDDAVAIVLLCHAAISAEDSKLRSVIIATILVALGEEP